MFDHESLSEAVASGDFMRILKAQQREIAETLPEEKGPAKAALHRQLSLISKQIAEMEAQEASEGGDGAAETEDDDWEGDL